jgi:hypothetical protein
MASVDYFVQHITTKEADISPSAPYTSSQRLFFAEGVIWLSFLLTIHDDRDIESTESADIVLLNAIGGSIGPQGRATINIVDDDKQKVSAKYSHLVEQSISASAGSTFTVLVNSILTSKEQAGFGGEKFHVKFQERTKSASKGSRYLSRPSVKNILDHGDGTYSIEGNLRSQGQYDLRTWHALRGGLLGEYYIDNFVENMVTKRIDRHVNFTWGDGELVRGGRDYITIRWRGAILSYSTGMKFFKVASDDFAQLWIDGDMVFDNRNHDGRSASLGKYYMVKNFLYEITLEYIELTGTAFVSLLWGESGNRMGVVPSLNLFSLYEINRSPATLSIRSGQTNSRSIRCHGDGCALAFVDSLSEFNICPRDYFGNSRYDTDLSVLSQENFKVHLSLYSNIGKGIGRILQYPSLKLNYSSFCWQASYTVEIAGLYVLSIVYREEGGRNDEHILGSPYIVTGFAAQTFPSNSIVSIRGVAISKSKLRAGTCMNFTITSRDRHHNFVGQGGDHYHVHLYRVSPLARTPRKNDFDVHLEVIRFGSILDHGNGNYSTKVCPISKGLFEVHMVMIEDSKYQKIEFVHQDFIEQDLSSGTHIRGSPFKLLVEHSFPVPSLCLAYGPGLIGTIVGVPTWFLITLRDAWNNLCDSEWSIFPVSILFLENTSYSVVNMHNGTYKIVFTPLSSGSLFIDVVIRNSSILGAPFRVPVLDGHSSHAYAYAYGKGLFFGTAGDLSSFEVISYDEGGNLDFEQDLIGFRFIVSPIDISGRSFQSIDRDMETCDLTSMCTKIVPRVNRRQFIGSWTPHISGYYKISIFIEKRNLTGSVVRLEIGNSPATVYISPTIVDSFSPVINGRTYSCQAGDICWIGIQLRDTYMNNVSVRSFSAPQLKVYVSNSSRILREYGRAIASFPLFHNLGGGFEGSFHIDQAGIYTLRVSLLVHGLKRTVYYDTRDGYASSTSQLENFHVKNAWHYKGKEKLSCGNEMKKSENVTFTYMNYRSLVDQEGSLSDDKPRENFWSMNFAGMLSFPFLERYTFHVLHSSSSYVSLQVGDSRGESNQNVKSSSGGLVVLQLGSISSIMQFDLNYTHHAGEPCLKLFWKSPSTPYGEIPTNAYFFRSNIQSYPLEVFPAVLDPSSSTAFGDALKSAVTDRVMTFTVQPRDIFGNPLNKGNHDIRVVGFGSNGLSFRGIVNDLGNATYIARYQAFTTGLYRMYIWVNFKQSQRMLDVYSEVEIDSLSIISGKPFMLRISAGIFNASMSIARGRGLRLHHCGAIDEFEIIPRDAYNNPLHGEISVSNHSKCSDYPFEVKFIWRLGDITSSPIMFRCDYEGGKILVKYSLSRSGMYDVYVSILNDFGRTAIKGSPFELQAHHGLVSFQTSFCRGRGLRFGNVDKTSLFNVYLKDAHGNSIDSTHYGLYVRIYSNATSLMAISPTIPSCFFVEVYHQCSYVLHASGNYTLQIALLDSEGTKLTVIQEEEMSRFAYFESPSTGTFYFHANSTGSRNTSVFVENVTAFDASTMTYSSFAVKKKGIYQVSINYSEKNEANKDIRIMWRSVYSHRWVHLPLTFNARLKFLHESIVVVT